MKKVLIAAIALLGLSAPPLFAAQVVFDFANLNYVGGVNSGFLPTDVGISCTGGNLCKWFYRAGLSGAPDGATHGLSSVGFSDDFFGVLDPSFNFTGPDLGGPDDGKVDGPPFGITTLQDNKFTWDGGKDTELIHNSITFTFFRA